MDSPEEERMWIVRRLSVEIFSLAPFLSESHVKPLILFFLQERVLVRQASFELI